jgi:hypothetical protein
VLLTSERVGLPTIGLNPWVYVFFFTSATVHCGPWLAIVFLHFRRSLAAARPCFSNLDIHFLFLRSFPKSYSETSVWLGGQLYCFLDKFVFLWDWDVNPMPNPQPEGPGCLSLSGTSLLTCPAWETLPVATLPPEWVHTSPPTTTRR